MLDPRKGALQAVVVLALFSVARAQVPQSAAERSAEARVRLEAAATAPFRQLTDGRNGALAAIHGGRIAMPGTGTLAERSRSFFAEHGALFGLDPRIELRIVERSTLANRATLALYRNDLPIEGILARVRFEGDELSSASLRAPLSAETTGSFAIGEAAATSVAMFAIQDQNGAAGTTAPPADPIVTRVYVPAPNALVAAYKVNIYAPADNEAWMALVDASNGELLDLQNQVTTANKGHLPVAFENGSLFFQKFLLGDAKGQVFATQVDAMIDVATTKSAKNFGSKGSAAANLAKGTIFGRVSRAFDANAKDPLENKLVYDYDPMSTTVLPSGIAEHDAFDCFNTHYQIEIFYQHLLSNLGEKQLASNLAMPVIVNFQAPSDGQGGFQVNAFFFPGQFPETGMSPTTFGFLKFFDLSPVMAGGPGFDVARDPAVACHEYVHAWLFYEDLSFSSPLNHPPRAIGEAIPDFYACTFHKDSIFGNYIGRFLAGGPFRTLQDDDKFPETTCNAIAFTGGACPGTLTLPEEHVNGETFGSFLLDVKDQRGDKISEQLVFNAMPIMPHTMSDVGFTNPQVVASPLVATQRFFFECAFATWIAANSPADQSAVFGSALGRGIFSGTDFIGSDKLTLLQDLESAPGHKVTIPTVFPRAAGSAQIAFHVKKGRKLTVTVKTSAGQTLTPDFTLVSSTGAPTDLTFPDAKTTSPDGKTVSQANISMNLDLGAKPLDGDPFYILTVNATNGLGYYKITLDA